jgi:hypothetical protein
MGDDDVDTNEPWWKNPFQSVGKFFGAGDDGGQQGLAGIAGLGMIGSNIWGGMAGPNQDSLSALNANLEPLEAQVGKYDDLINMYSDPNSQFNQNQFATVRADTNAAIYDQNARERAKALGTGYEGLGKLQDDSFKVDVASGGIENLLRLNQDRFKNIAGLMGTQSQLQNQIAQAQNQNYMYSQQQGQMMPQMLSNQFAGLMKHAMAPV